MNVYQDETLLETSMRTVNHEGVSELLWISMDTKAFTGPLRDWELDKDNFLKFVKEKNTVVQAGGNCGMYARFYGNYFSKVYSFEPDPSNFHCLQFNCQGEKYNLYNVALGKEKGKATLHFPKRKFRNAGIWQVVEDQNGNVDIITIDSLELNSCDLMHLDVEGYESNVLEGAKETINKYHPVIILEAGHGYEIAEQYGYKVIEKLTTDWIMLHESGNYGDNLLWKN